jgi:uncharacterized protein (TIGR03083 family)
MHVDVYRSTRERLSDVVNSLTDEQLATTVPATPEWTVQGLLSHLVGVATDLSRMPAGAPHAVIPPPDAYTAMHIVQRQDRSAAEIVVEWDKSGPMLEERMRNDWGAWSAPMHDLLCHEADIRGALQLPRMPEEAWRHGSLDIFPAFLTEFAPRLSRRWALPDVGTLTVHTGDAGTYTLGTGEPTATVTVPEAYELWRAMFGRRSKRQMSAWDWSVDPAPYLQPLSFFDITEKDLTER